MVLIDGRIRSRKYSGKDGIEHIVYNNIGSEMKMLDIRNETTVMSDNGNSAPAAINSPLSELSIQTSCPTPLTDRSIILMPIYRFREKQQKFKSQYLS